MGLSVTVGILAELAIDDPGGASRVRAEFDAMNAVLRRAGLPEHSEPASLPILEGRTGVDGFASPFLHYLRRYYARWVSKLERKAHPSQSSRFADRAPRKPVPVLKGEDPSDDPVLNRITSPRHHLLWHSDREGYYLPIDFPEVLEGDRRTGGPIGSSVRLLDELVTVAAPLGIALRDGRLADDDAARIAAEGESAGPFRIERLVWLTLFEAARLSLEHRSAIHFG